MKAVGVERRESHRGHEGRWSVPEFAADKGTAPPLVQDLIRLIDPYWAVR